MGAANQWQIGGAAQPAEPTSRGGSVGSGRWLIWAALAVAFSPVLADLGKNLELASKHSYLLAIAGLLGFRIATGRQRPAEPPRRLGWALVGVAVLLELAGLAADTAFLWRASLPVAWLGVALGLGRPGLGTACLVLWLIPLPDAATGLWSPQLEMRLAALAAGLASTLGANVEAVGLSLVGPSARLDLRPGNAGLLLAHGLAALGWFRAVQAGAGLAAAARRACLFAAGAVVVQPVGVAIAGLLVALDAAGFARWWLTQGLWMATGLGFAAAVALRTRSDFQSGWPASRSGQKPGL